MKQKRNPVSIRKLLAFLLALVMVAGMIPFAAITASAATPGSGYTNSDPATDVMAYRVRSSTTIDVQGYYNNRWVRTTFNNNGYTHTYTYNSGSMSVAQKATVVQGGRYVMLTYTVTAGASGVSGGKLAFHSDVMIDSDDRATVSTIRSGGQAVGLKMVNRSNGAQYNLYFAGVAGVTPVTTYWFGGYSSRYNNLYNQINTDSVSGIDSGMAVSWQNINLGAYESKSFSAVIGVGNLSDQIETPDPTDPASEVLRLTGNYGFAPKFDVALKFTDTNPGVTDTLKYMIGGNEYTLGSAAAAGVQQTLTGTVDLTGFADGSYPVSFWVINSNGALSTAVERTIVIADGRIVSGLDAAVVQINLYKDGALWTEGTNQVLLGTQAGTVVANGSVIANGSYLVFVNGHALGSAGTMAGGPIEMNIAWKPLPVISATAVSLGLVRYGTAFDELPLPVHITVATADKPGIQVAIAWNAADYDPTLEGAQTITGTIVSDYYVEADGLTVTATVTVDEKPHEHAYDTHIEIPATCDSIGVSKDVCDCGAEANVHYTAALGHSYKSEIILDAVCGEDGLIRYTCDRVGCGHSYDVITHAEHTYVQTVTPPTCTEDGATVYTCTSCGDVQKTVIPASHSYTSEVVKVATRYEDGEIVYTCSKCGHTYSEIIPASHANILLIQDTIPWDVNSLPSLFNEMTEKGYISGWAAATTATVAQYELSEFDVIYIANDQTTATYNQLLAFESALVDFVNGGGTLIYGACDHGWSAGDISYNILGDVVKTDYYSMHNYIVDPAHPIVTGSLTDDRAITNDLLLGTYCSHSGFVESSLPAGYNIILQDAQGNATLAEYPLGNGRVIVSGLTWEFYYSRIYTGTTSYSMNVFDDLIAYAVNPAPLCTHQYDVGVTVEATCTTEGYIKHTCALCGHIYKSNYIPAPGHIMGELIVDVEATCSVPGSAHQICSRCGETVTLVIPAIGHAAGDWIVDREASAEADGLRRKECGHCHETLVSEVLHYFVSVNVPATCTQTGISKEICSCGLVRHVHIIPATGHDYVTEVIRVVTCTSDGLIRYTCLHENCGHSYDVVIRAEHHYVHTKVEPTCTEDGLDVYTCSKCGDVQTMVIPAGHSYTATVTKIATRYEEGEIVYTCTRCGHTYTEITPATNANVLLIQDRIPWDVDNTPVLFDSLTEKGIIEGWALSTTASISLYNLSDFDVIFIANDQTTATYDQLRTLDEALTAFVNGGGTLIYGACDHGWADGDISYNILGTVKKTDYYSMHNYIADPLHPIVTGALTDDRALTNELLLGTYCSHGGFPESSLPAGYNVILQDGQGNPTLAEYPQGEGRVILSGMTWEFYYSRIYTGTTSYSMNVFDDLIAYAVNPVSHCVHAYDAGVVVEPTCTTVGYTKHTCALCGNTYKGDYLPALGHVDGEWTVETEPTCTAAGLAYHICDRCEGLLTVVIPATDHTAGDWIIDRPATETEDGLRHKECAVCHITLRTETFTLLKNGIVKDDDGKIRYYVDGVPQHAGLVQDSSGNYYYFGSDLVAATGTDRHVSMFNDLLPKGTYTFDENGHLILPPDLEIIPPEEKNGVVKDFDGNLRYYVDGEAVYAGLVQDENGNYYYFTSHFVAAVNKTHYVAKNNGLLPAGEYTFDENGRLVNPPVVEELPPELKNGIIKDLDGKIRYYVEGVAVRAGLVQDANGDYYYFTSALTAVVGSTYYCSNHNNLLPPAEYTFDENGKMIDIPTVEVTPPAEKNGIVKDFDGKIRYYVNGVVTYAGLVQDENGDYYYFGSSLTAAVGITRYVSKTNGLLPMGNYTFDADGKMIDAPVA